MADYLVTDTELTSIASAIRTKGSTTAALEFPTGFVSAIEAITTYTAPILQAKTNINPTTSSQTISADNGYDGLSSVQINAMPSGTAGTPTATKGTVSNNSISITPSVTNVTGYITGGTISGTAVTVSASELVSGNKAISANGTGIDVTNYATVSVAVSPNLQAKTGITPTENSQTITAGTGYDGLSSVQINAISSTYVGSGIDQNDSDDLTASGATVTVPAGYYASQATKSISSGSATTPATTITANPIISIDSSGLITATASATQSITPTISAGYISAGTAGTITVSGSATSQLTIKAATTYTPTTSDQTIAAATYLTGTQTIKGDANLVATNIKSGVTIFGVTGAYEGSDGGGVTQDENGYIILPSTGSGGGSGDSSGSDSVLTTVTGTFTGNDTNVATISCAFEPREIYISGDLTSDASLRGVVNFRLIKDNFICVTNDSSTSNTNEGAWVIENITGFNEANSSTQPYASYSNGTLTINTVQNSSGARFPSGIIYSYKLVGLVSSQHTIHLDFTDNTSTDINVAYTDALIGTMITTYTPTTYGQKTVSSAALDNVTWYTRSTVVWETLYNDTIGYYEDSNASYSYCWVTALADVEIAVDSTWRVTFDNVEYVLTGKYDAQITMNVIGNSLYGGGTDDNSDTPFYFYQTPWGAWSGSCNDTNTNHSHNVKIERGTTA